MSVPDAGGKYDAKQMDLSAVVAERIRPECGAMPHPCSFAKRVCILLKRMGLGFWMRSKSLQIAENKGGSGERRVTRRRLWRGKHPRGCLDRCENMEVAGKAIRKVMKTKGGRNSQF
jgi:hypothetical protein